MPNLLLALSEFQKKLVEELPNLKKLDRSWALRGLVIKRQSMMVHKILDRMQ